MIKLAFTGRAGSGKTTLATWFVENYDCVRLAFADQVKYFAKEILMRPIDKHDPADRKFLQILGTDLARARDPDIWLKHMEQRLAVTEGMSEGYVIDDCRFVNEADWLKKHGFTLIKVVGRGYSLSPELSNHPSEAEVDKIVPDFTVDNSGKLGDTIAQLILKITGVTPK